MNASLINTIAPAAQSGAAYPPVPPLLEGLGFTDPDMIAACADLELLVQRAEQARHVFNAAENDDVNSEAAHAADDAWCAIRSAADAASYAILDEDAPVEECAARVLAFLRARLLIMLDADEWRQVYSFAEARKFQLEVARDTDIGLFDALDYAIEKGVDVYCGTDERGSDERWSAATAAYAAAIDQDARLRKATEVASAAVEAEAPKPAVLEGLDWLTEKGIEQAKLTFDEKVERMTALRAWKARQTAAMERHRYEQAFDEYDAHNPDKALVALIDTPVPNLLALTEKTRLYVSNIYCDRIGQSVDDPGTISELLSRSDFGAWGATRLYQDLLRLAGLRPEIVAAEPFDAKGWIAEFYSHPWHYFTAAKEPRYSGPARPSWEAITLTDAAEIQAYRSTRLGEEAPPMADGDTLTLGPASIPFVRAAVAISSERRAEIEQAVTDYFMRPMPGMEAWKALEPWQQEVVKTQGPADAMTPHAEAVWLIDRFRWCYGEITMRIEADGSESLTLVPPRGCTINAAVLNEASVLAVRAREADLETEVMNVLRDRGEAIVVSA